MGEIKTQANDRSVENFLAGLSPDQQYDSRQLVTIMTQISGEPATMWGKSIVGFGTYRYKYASGREGDWMRIGFSPRKTALTLYLTSDASSLADELSTLGKHTVGKGCIYIKHLSDIDTTRLRHIIKQAYEKSPV